LIRGEPDHDIIETLYPRSCEPIIDKPGKGSFYATDLECILQANNISTLLVCGVTTEVCVHTTVREANDRGYHCIVVGDACASYSDEFHEVALRMIVAQGGIFGSVTTSDDVIAALLNVKKDCDQVLNTLDGQTGCLSATDSISNSRMKKSNAFASRPMYIPGQTPPRPSLSFGKAKQIFNPSELASAYNLMISSLTPRPIALVSSRSENGIDNVAPFSYFGAVAHDPPMLTIGFCRKGRDHIQKDSLVNIMAQKEFAVNIISEWYIDAANHACGMFPPEVDEFNVSGLTKVDDCEVVNAPRVGEAAVTYECKLAMSIQSIMRKVTQPRKLYWQELSECMSIMMSW
jgi:flavin reductase (DIM6/NTAB) family NADH-FMN oxidoreductase RutF